MPRSPFETVYLHDRVTRWRNGDNAAADDLLMACAGQLERLARKMLRGFPAVRGQADTADVLQGASLRLLSALRQVRPSSTREFFGLSALQIRRELLDLARQVARRPTVGLDKATEVAGPPDDQLDLWGAFHLAVESLPTDQREVVGLLFYHGWTQAQVAELLGVCERTVRRTWAAACKRLFVSLNRELPALDE